MAREGYARGRSARQRKRNRRRRLAGMIYRLVLLALMVTVFVLAITVFFKISDIRVEGESRYSQQEIVAALGISPGDNLFFVNKFKAKDRLFDAFVYLDEVSISRQLPDTLLIQVKDCAPVAAVQATDGAYYLLDRKGKLLEQTTPEIAQAHILLYGVDLTGLKIGGSISQVKEGKRALELIAVMDDNGILSKISYFDVSYSYDLAIGYEDRFDVQIGSLDQLDRKIRFMNSVVERLSRGDRGIIDLKSSEKEARFRPQEQLPPRGAAAQQTPEDEDAAQPEETQSGEPTPDEQTGGEQ